MMDEWVLYLLFGALAGVLSGLFGIGGGVVIVPFLAWRFPLRNFPPEHVMVIAVATSLSTIVITSIASIHAHHHHGAVDWRVVGRMAPGILVGTLLGSIVADHLPAYWFKLIFAGFLLYVAARLLLKQAEQGRELAPGIWLFGLAGGGIGLASAILGIGGGTLSVPFLARCGYSIRHAVAISSTCGFPIAIAGTLSYIALGWNQPGLPSPHLGYVYLPACLGIIITSTLFAPLGARLTHRLPTERLRRYFGVLVLAIGVKLLWQALEGPI